MHPQGSLEGREEGRGLKYEPSVMGFPWNDRHRSTSGSRCVGTSVTHKIVLKEMSAFVVLMREGGRAKPDTMSDTGGPAQGMSTVFTMDGAYRRISSPKHKSNLH